jgi:solute carrier family 35 (UDP-sugar transporter), member A1/2/3
MYADNVLKGFATSFSVILSCIISSWLLEAANMNAIFTLGAATVVASALVYSLFPAQSVASTIPSAARINKKDSNASDSNLQSRDTNV